MLGGEDDLPAALIDRLKKTRRLSWRPALGWGISLLAHAIAAAWVWHASLPNPANVGTEAVKRIEILLVQHVPSVLRQVSAPPARIAASSRKFNRAAAADTAIARTAPFVPRQPEVSATPPALPSQGDAPTIREESAQVFDLSAARASARAMTHEDRKNLEALPLRQGVNDARSSARIQERFERARRVNCLKANDSTNLLANVFFLAKDMVSNAADNSGCKW